MKSSAFEVWKGTKNLNRYEMEMSRKKMADQRKNEEQEEL